MLATIKNHRMGALVAALLDVFFMDGIYFAWR